MLELADFGEVEEIFDGLGTERLEIHGDSPCDLGSTQRHGTLRDLHQHAEALAPAGGVGHHHLAAQHPLDQDLGIEEAVDLLAVLGTEAVYRIEEILTDQNGQLALGG